MLFMTFYVLFSDKNGFGPIAMYPHKCTFSRDPSQEIDTNDPDTLLNSQDIIDDG